MGWRPVKTSRPLGGEEKQVSVGVEQRNSPPKKGLREHSQQRQPQRLEEEGAWPGLKANEIPCQRPDRGPIRSRLLSSINPLFWGCWVALFLGP